MVALNLELQILLRNFFIDIRLKEKIDFNDTESIFRAISSNNYQPLRLAFIKNQIKIINIIFALVKDDKIKHEMIEAVIFNNYIYFRYAAMNGNLELINIFFKIAPDKMRNQMINILKYDNNIAFTWIIINDRIRIVDKLLEFASLNVCIEMINIIFNYKKNQNAVGFIYIEAVSKIAYKINDTNTLKKVLNKTSYIDEEFEEYKKDPELLINLGRANKNLLSQKWSYDNIREISSLVKKTLPFVQISKNFCNIFTVNNNRNLDFYIVNKIIHYLTYDIEHNSSLNDEQRTKIVNTMKYDEERKPLRIDYKNISYTKSKISFLERLSIQKTNINISR